MLYLEKKMFHTIISKLRLDVTSIIIPNRIQELKFHGILFIEKSQR